MNEMLRRPVEEKYAPDFLDQRKLSTFETSLVPHTTGTTGMPKLVATAMCAQLWRGRSYLPLLKFTTDDIFGIFAPVSAGPNGPAFFTAPQIAAKVVLLEKWDVEGALKLIEKEKITAGLLVPTMLVQMVQHPKFGSYDLSSLRLVWTAGAPLPYHQAVEVEEKFGCPLIQHYGAVDSDISIISPVDDLREVRRMTVGKPMGATEVRLVDENGRDVPKGEVGEVWGRGPTCTPGYFLDDEATRKAWQGGWFRMEDLAKWDDKGNLVIVGRIKDLIIRGGQNIYPAEVEDMLRTHPSVADTAIVGMPDPVMGQRCCAYVVLRPGQALAFDDMISFLKEKKFAPYRLPERLEIIESLPRVGDQQKVDKKVLEKQITAKLQGEGKI
jgi:non-ribosomal peptide synthetase component E (peptide arylation enzyme)